MTTQIYSENTRKIFQHKKEIEQALDLKINKSGNVILLEGEAEKEFLGLNFVEAVNLGFSIEKALDLRYEDMAFLQLKIKDIAKRKNLNQVRGRIIGKDRKVMDNIEFLSGCSLALHNNNLGIIGTQENIKKAETALKNLIAGSKHATIYAYLEKEKAKESIFG